MTILAGLARAYDRMPGAAPPGYSPEKIGVIVSIDEHGKIRSVSLRQEASGRRSVIPRMLVPEPAKKSVNISPNFLWGNTAYVLKITNRSDKTLKRLAEEHAAFVRFHTEKLAGADDVGLKALLAFLAGWTPDQFCEPVWRSEMKDLNLAFALESQRLDDIYLHDRPAARAIWDSISQPESSDGICLVTGIRGPIARLHPAIKGVSGSQTSGASIVSFNQPSFESYGHAQGENAPVSKIAAFKYGTALNALLASGKNRVALGDMTVVYWAYSDDPQLADEAEGIFRGMMDVNEAVEADRVGAKLKLIARGVPLSQVEPKLEKGVRFYVLGLSPNASRLLIRFWFEDDFGELTERYQQYGRDVSITPWPPHRPQLNIKSAVLRTAPARRDRTGKITFEREQTSPLLAGELLRAVLSGTLFPGALLGLLLTRIRADGLLDSTRVAMVKAIIVRRMRRENRLPNDLNSQPMENYLVRSDPDDPNPARRLGRLFALIERAQLAALGEDINVTVKDKYLGAAAAMPQQVMSKLVLNAEEHHLKRLRNGHSDASWITDSRHARAVGAGLSRDIGKLWGAFEGGLPAQHSNEEQGLFLVGYYQERYGTADRKGDSLQNEAEVNHQVEE